MKKKSKILAEKFKIIGKDAKEFYVEKTSEKNIKN